MKTMRKALAKGTFATAAAGAMALASTAPAAAQDHHRDRDDGIGAGEIIAGAVILGGLAAILSSGDDRDDRDDRRYRDGYRYGGDDHRYDRRNRRGRHYRGDRRGVNNRGLNARSAVERCVRAAERRAQRYGGRNAEVYEVYDVDRERRGYEIKGRIAVREGRGYGHRRGYRNDGWDEGRFVCEVRLDGRITDLDYRGIRGL